MTSSTHYVHNSTVDGSLYVNTWSKFTEGYYQCRAINVAGVAMSNVSFVQEACILYSMNFSPRTMAGFSWWEACGPGWV